jgi:hypothetical protein
MDSDHTLHAVFNEAPPPPPLVGGYAEFVTEVYPPVSELSFARILTIMILAIALIIAATCLSAQTKFL